MFGKSMHWWFGKNSLWQRTGADTAVASTGPLGGLLSGITGFLTGKTQPSVTVDHGVSDTVKYGAIALVAYLIIK